MNRYFYYLIVMNMLVNTILFVPRTLIIGRYNGALMSILISIPLGTGLVIMLTRTLRRFPGMGLPELLRQWMPAWLRIPLLLYLSLMWFLAGALVLVTFGAITRSFINPDMPLTAIMLAFLFVVTLGATRPSSSVLFALEIVLLMSTPFIALILFKAMSNQYMNWDAIRVVAGYWDKAPSVSGLSAASYIFSGYSNMLIFNRLNDKPFVPKWIWLIPALGAGVLATTFFIPIGFHGTTGVEQYMYSWVSTADSMRMELGPVERVAFVFLLLYLNISIILGIVSWHVGTELVSSLFSVREHRSSRSAMLVRWMICVVMGGGIVGFLVVLSEKTIIEWAAKWLELRFASEILLVLLIVLLARRKKPVCRDSAVSSH
ncbi:hypothetical protein PAESOLCIP111_02945 [Paenibacillus solanacearum]|uniref:GerAB/ArcD/ProY family transporter n=1 Tax=Paenibacillus solanacearum TaxID=2048548 RepID=A0A916K1Y4_9BACL|nr:GerAB/ArcD/ProY family transporter [Paenibacillus solanacearum]CAG7627711.1 hypothetical protein PAESOLCIP111_02945 [Paenibacillus solanacearum]